MLELQKSIQESKETFNIADHLVYTTYYNLREVKLLYRALEHLNTAIIKALDSLLTHARYYKEVSFIPKDLNSKLDLLDELTIKYGFDPKIKSLIIEINRTIEANKESPITFQRRDKLVICNDRYQLRIIDDRKIKNYLVASKVFIDRVEAHINGRI